MNFCPRGYQFEPKLPGIRGGDKTAEDEIAVYPSYKRTLQKMVGGKFSWDVEIVRRAGEGNQGVWCPIHQEPPPIVRGFKIVKRRWVVERTFGWFGRWRRLGKDFEAIPKTSESMIYLAMAGLMLSRLAV